MTLLAAELDPRIFRYAGKHTHHRRVVHIMAHIVMLLESRTQATICHFVDFLSVTCECECGVLFVVLYGQNKHCTSLPQNSRWQSENVKDVKMSRCQDVKMLPNPSIAFSHEDLRSRERTERYRYTTVQYNRPIMCLHVCSYSIFKFYWYMMSAWHGMCVAVASLSHSQLLVSPANCQSWWYGRCSVSWRNPDICEYEMWILTPTAVWKVELLAHTYVVSILRCLCEKDESAARVCCFVDWESREKYWVT